MFTEGQRVKSKATGLEGVVLQSMELVCVKFDGDGEKCIMSASQLDLAGDHFQPPPIAPALENPIVQFDEVVCVSRWWCSGCIGIVTERIGGRVHVEWDRKHWRYAGQNDGWYAVDHFAFYDRSVVSDAA